MLFLSSYIPLEYETSGSSIDISAIDCIIGEFHDRLCSRQSLIHIFDRDANLSYEFFSEFLNPSSVFAHRSVDVIGHTEDDFFHFFFCYYLLDCRNNCFGSYGSPRKYETESRSRYTTFPSPIVDRKKIHSID